MRVAHGRYAEIAPLWTAVAGHLAAAGETGDAAPLAPASPVLANPRPPASDGVLATR